MSHIRRIREQFDFRIVLAPIRKFGKMKFKTIFSRNQEVSFQGIVYEGVEGVALQTPA